MSSAVIEVRSSDQIRYRVYSRICLCRGKQGHDELLAKLESIEGVTVVDVLGYSAVIQIDPESDWDSIEPKVIEIIRLSPTWEWREIAIERYIAPFGVSADSM